MSKEEQLQRFLDRENDPYKAWKLTDEDWRNRDKWSKYEVAAEDMFDKTDTANAPWVVVPGNNKRYARIHVLEETLRLIEENLEKRGLTLTDALGNTPDGEEMIKEKEKIKKKIKKKHKKK